MSGIASTRSSELASREGEIERAAGELLGQPLEPVVLAEDHLDPRPLAPERVQRRREQLRGGGLEDPDAPRPSLGLAQGKIGERFGKRRAVTICSRTTGKGARTRGNRVRPSPAARDVTEIAR
jgi:hypothetical protein